ncbi:MAG: hypothetical protein LBL65_07825 [Campylobacteraceae bacterium]|nr:hypothetical protein [Campylobacteraceae bacterium]
MVRKGIRIKIKIDTLVLALSSPLIVGIYNQSSLIKTYRSNEPSSEALPKIFDEILRFYDIGTLFYTNGPGSFMSIKVSYVFLKSLSIALKIPLLACDGFTFNANSPIKALGSQWFFKEEEGIVLKPNPKNEASQFILPLTLDKSLFENKNEPLYILPAV